MDLVATRIMNHIRRNAWCLLRVVPNRTLSAIIVRDHIRKINQVMETRGPIVMAEENSSSPVMETQGPIVMAEKRSSVCVTGASGYIASWLIQLLLSDGYTVHEIVKNPEDEKSDNLKKLNKAENLRLFKGNIQEYHSIVAAFAGCDGVFHIASPTLTVPNLVLRACVELKIKRIVFCWYDNGCHRTIKMVEEDRAVQYAQQHGFDGLLFLRPTTILGPRLQSTRLMLLKGFLLLFHLAVEYLKQGIVSTWRNWPSGVFGHMWQWQSLLLLKVLTEEEYENELVKLEKEIGMTVDVRLVAKALKLIYEQPEAEGAYICTGRPVKSRDLMPKQGEFGGEGVEIAILAWQFFEGHNGPITCLTAALDFSNNSCGFSYLVYSGSLDFDIKV